MRIFLVILAALIVAGGTGFYVLQGLRPPTPTEVVKVEAPRLKEVYVPTGELAAGTLITTMHLSRMQMSEGALTPQMIVADAEGEGVLVGSVARQVLPQGVPIARSAIVQPGDRGFLAAVLPKGMRAITIPVSDVAGLSGLVLPGDRVDIILTYSISGDLIDAEREIRASETVMNNIRVLALDQRLQSGAPAPNEKGEVEKPPTPKTATLEVTSHQAEVITLAQTLGGLSLVLNSVRDGGDDADDANDKLDRTDARLVDSLSRTIGQDPSRPRNMTIDSDVTSLLKREEAAQASKVPVPDRTTKVQVVRGVTTHAIQLGAEIGAPAPAPEAPAAEVPAPATE